MNSENKIPRASVVETLFVGAILGGIFGLFWSFSCWGLSQNTKSVIDQNGIRIFGMFAGGMGALIAGGITSRDSRIAYGIGPLVGAIVGLLVTWKIEGLVGAFVGGIIGGAFGGALGGVIGGIKNGTTIVEKRRMDRSFEFSVLIMRPVEEVFDIFADPRESAKVCSDRKVEELTRMPATVGTRWLTKGGLFGLWKTRYVVTEYNKLYGFAKRTIESMPTIVTDLFESIDGGTKVTRKIDVKRIPWTVSTDFIKAAEQSRLEKLKTYLEPQAPSASGNEEDEFTKRVKCSYTVIPSTLIKRRKQVTVNSETIITVAREKVFDVVIKQVDGFWKWMVVSGRANPTGQLDVSPNWPKKGSYYRYRIKTKERFNKWETGLIQIEECIFPEHVLMREDQNAHIYKNTFFTDWKFEKIEGGTHLTVRYDITQYNFLWNVWVARRYGPWFVKRLQREVANIIRVCEKK